MNPVYWMLLTHGDLSPNPDELTKKGARGLRIALLRHARDVGSLEALVDQHLSSLPQDLQRVLTYLLKQAPSMALVWDELKNQGIRAIPLASPQYPERLKNSLATQTPLLLYVLGEDGLLRSERTMAIVGSRNASAEALRVAREAGRYFGREGYTIVTGMAKGVDQEAVRSALEAGGKAIGVLPFGLLSKKDLLPLLKEYQESLTGGQLTLISEVFPKTGWKAQLAMARNRLVVGLADGVVVAQSGLKESTTAKGKHQSGTWNAVETSRRIGKKVYVADLPFEGNQALIKQGLGKPIPVQEAEVAFAFIEDELYLMQKASHKSDPVAQPSEAKDKEEKKGAIQVPLFDES
jgi:DNA processing protein